MKKRIAIIAGARPNFIKIAPVIREINNQASFDYFLVHTGQHYDIKMSEVFFFELGIPKPDINLGVGSLSNTAQRAKIMEKMETVCLKERPDLVVVVGDVNSTIGAALAAVEFGIPVAHIEAGLRSFDLTMPEEINRILTDRLSHYLFVTEESGVHNLKEEGVASQRIFFVGNVMIDNLLYQMPYIESASVSVPKQPYMVVTLHRPSNVDTKNELRTLIRTLRDISRKVPLIFPIHPRTLKNINKFHIDAGREIALHDLEKIESPGIYLLTPLGYNEFLKLVKESIGIITDSGGIQEETTYLGIPCLTIRRNTERPVTIEKGTNILIGSNVELLKKSVQDILSGNPKRGEIPPLWDGKTTSRILTILDENL